MTRTKAILLIPAVLAVAGCDYEIKSVSADEFMCDAGASIDKPYAADKKCVLEGRFTVSVNPTANACAIEFQNLQIPKLHGVSRGRLAFVDSNNWECDEDVDAKSIGKEAEMASGKLEIRSVDHEHVVGPIKYSLKQIHPLRKFLRDLGIGL